MVREQVIHFPLAAVQWYKPHSNKNGMGKPAQIWCYNSFEDGGIYSFLPVRNLTNRYSFSTATFDDELVVIVVPLPE